MNIKDLDLFSFQIVDFVDVFFVSVKFDIFAQKFYVMTKGKI